MSNFGSNTNTNTNTGSVDANAPGPQHRGTAGQKIRGAAEVIHGIGENIRGRLMDAVDGSTQPHPETHQGRLEVERGMAKIMGGAGAGATSAGAGAGAGGPTSANSGYTQSSSSYDAPTQQQQQQQLQPNRRTECGSPASVQGSNVLGPTSGMTSGFGNGGPEVEMASAPYQQQPYSAGAGGMQAGTNDRDFGNVQRNTMGQQSGSTPGPAPDRYAMGGQPTNLP